MELVVWQTSYHERTVIEGKDNRSVDPRVMILPLILALADFARALARLTRLSTHMMFMR